MTTEGGAGSNSEDSADAEPLDNYCPRCGGLLELVDSLSSMHMMKQCEDCEVIVECPHPAILNDTGQYELTPELLDELPDHPAGRLWPGWSNEGHDIVRTIVYEAPSGVLGGRLHGFIVAGAATVHTYAEDQQHAGRVAADGIRSGDLRAMPISSGREIAEVDTELLIDNHYSRDGQDWPAYEVDVVGAGQFYGSGDDAVLSETALYCIDPGDIERYTFVKSWIARPQEVDVSRLAVSKESVRRRLERLEERDGDD